MAHPDHEVLIIGTGFSGLCVAIMLRQAGIENFVLLERAHELGGTWRDNTYPGCACDVPSHLYSFSFAPKPNWTRAFAQQPEIQSYLLDCAQRYQLRPKMRFNAEVVRAEYHEGSALWHVHTRDGRQWSARLVVSAIGPLSNPALPNIPGLDQFEGEAFHSATWRHHVDLRDKRVAVVGTGASAIQIVPAIAPQVGELYLFQRTPAWIVPRADREFSQLERWCFANVPGLQAARRALIYSILEARVLGFTRYPGVLRMLQRLALRHLHRQVKDPALRRALTPDYTMGCKRILLSDDFYPALTRANVHLIPSAVREVTARGVVDGGGKEREVDVIIFSTGFQVQELVPEGMFLGPGGKDLAAHWREAPEAYKGTTVAGYPNLFFLLGPNTGLGHSSMVYIIESQVAYVVDAVRRMRAEGWRAVAVRPEVQAQFNAQIQAQSQGTVWQTGCRSWYLNSQGRNTTVWPSFTFRFRQATASFDAEAYHIQQGTP